MLFLLTIYLAFGIGTFIALVGVYCGGTVGKMIKYTIKTWKNSSKLMYIWSIISMPLTIILIIGLWPIYALFMYMTS